MDLMRAIATDNSGNSLSLTGNFLRYYVVIFNRYSALAQLFIDTAIPSTYLRKLLNLKIINMILKWNIVANIYPIIAAQF